jgi:hypothetical protein
VVREYSAVSDDSAESDWEDDLHELIQTGLANNEHTHKRRRKQTARSKLRYHVGHGPSSVAALRLRPPTAVREYSVGRAGTREYCRVREYWLPGQRKVKEAPSISAGGDKVSANGALTKYSHSTHSLSSPCSFLSTRGGVLPRGHHAR